ncbi:hypothetical protein A2223_02295 [Candidatus Falkowbacteria bacterium RIFOXYA2_FULL_35_8]|nr:MAG: hypothetical protein A2223_02295 [Candidatus Falkowbacteria bacterium RIFOXYA2_FULL_35_8]
MIEHQIIEAIKNKKMISFTYIEKEALRDIRRAAPHAFFVSTAGNKNVDAFQYDGYSKKGSLPAWRQFTIDNIRDLVLLDENFEVAHGYNPYSKQYDRAICKI